MKLTIKSTGEKVEVNDSNFVAKGGEGSIYIVGDRVFKVCVPGAMIPEEKFKELNVLDHPKIVKPEDILLDGHKRQVGYWMRAVPNNPSPLVKILSKTYREREGVSPQMMTDLVSQMANGIRFVHSKSNTKGKYLQVDGNEMNYMVTADHKQLYFIDVNSFQTPSFPATAIMASIRDWNCGDVWTELTDWYSFCIMSWYMFTAIHPFMGSHPNFKIQKTAMVDQMKANISVLNKEVGFPKAAVYHPFEDVIPGGASGAFMQWYRAILLDGKRLPAPISFQAAIQFVAKVKEIMGSNMFDINLIHELDDAITGYYNQRSTAVYVTKGGIFANNQKFPLPATRFRIGFTPTSNCIIAASIDDESLRLQNLETKEPLKIDCRVKDIMSYGGRLYAQGINHVYEISYLETGNTLTPFAHPVASIMEHATQMFQGVVVQEMFGKYMVSVFPGERRHHQIQIKELDGKKIVDAKFEGNVLMAVTFGDDGDYARHIFRFASDWGSYDVRTIEHIPYMGLNFTVLQMSASASVVVCITEEEKLEIFSSQKDSPSVKVMDDPAITGDMRLCHVGNKAHFAKGAKFYGFSIRK